MASAPERLVIVAPNWLGDAVMALPLVHALRRAWPTTHLAVAARRSIAPLFGMVGAIEEVVLLQGRGGLGAIASVGADAAELARHGFDAALLLPNSFLSAFVVARAGIKERWGFRTDWRSPMLTRAIPRPPRTVVHQAAYYHALVQGLGITAPRLQARIDVSESGRRAAQALLQSAGIAENRQYVAMAPGAAYGRAKQWLPERFAELSRVLRTERGLPTVLVGAAADARVCREIATGAGGAIDLSGRTDIPTLAGVLASAHAVVANDSGAMHLAAAVGARVVAIFGATNEQKSAPLSAGSDAPAPTIVATHVWCRPCMLRECPIDHRCMTGISVDAVLAHI